MDEAVIGWLELINRGVSDGLIAFSFHQLKLTSHAGDHPVASFLLRINSYSTERKKKQIPRSSEALPTADSSTQAMY